NDVMNATQRKQVPWEHSALTKRVYFNAVVQTALPTPVAPVRLSEAAEAWGATRDTTNIAVLEAYIVRYSDTFYAELARARIDELKKQEDAKPDKSEPSWKEKINKSNPSPPPPKSDPPTQVAIATPPLQPALPKLREPAAAITPARCDGVET